MNKYALPTIYIVVGTKRDVCREKLRIFNAIIENLWGFVKMVSTRQENLGLNKLN